MEIKDRLMSIKPYSPPTEGRKGKLRLDFNENTVGCSPKVLKAIQNITMEELNAYPEYEDTLRQLASYLMCSPEQLLLTNGLDDGIRQIFETFTNDKDNVLLPYPTFSMYEIYGRLANVRFKKVLYKNDLSFPFDEFIRSIGQNIRLIILVNPNNPTGSSLTHDQIKIILEKAKDIPVVIDEAYSEFLGYESSSLLSKYSNLILMRTFSKGFGLAGLRIGYLYGNPSVIQLLRLTGSPYAVNSVACIALKAAISDSQFTDSYIGEVSKSKAFLRTEMTSFGFEVYKSDANFLVIKFEKLNSYIVRGLKEQGILIRDQSKFPLLEGCSRITLGTIKQMQKLVGAIKELLARPVMLFDMDGVLVDVSKSYRRTIKETFSYFAKEDITYDEIDQIKEIPGFNNDWDATKKLLRNRGYDIDETLIVDKFQELYLGENGNGYIQDEKWIFSQDKIKSLFSRYRMGVVTGRPRKEALIALENADTRQYFDVLVTLDETPQGLSKPNPYPLNLALKLLKSKNGYYFGDTINDAIAAIDASIIPVAVQPKLATTILLEDKGVGYMIESINDMEGIF